MKWICVVSSADAGRRVSKAAAVAEAQ